VEREHVGIRGVGLYIPDNRMTSEEIAVATHGSWSKVAIEEKLGIIEKSIPGENDGTQEMGVNAARDALEKSSVEPEEIDVILCIGEEWKEYPLTTSALYIQDQIGAVNAWGIDLQNRCCTTLSAMKMAKDMLKSDISINTIMIVGGYRNGDLVDYTDKPMSMMYNLSAGAGALILQSGMKENLVLGSHILSDGSLSRDAGVSIGGIVQPIDSSNVHQAYKSLTVMRPDHMKARLNEVSMENWLVCIDEALRKSNMTRSDVDYLAVLHFKRSMHHYLLNILGLDESKSIYLENYGHMGQVDQILSLKLGLESKKVKPGSTVLMIAAGIGYVWAASVVKWGEA
jgi:3-oxoacyl-[acyl-carrier-protein] synthase-3